MRTRQRVFLDASVWIAGAASVSGGSALVIELSRAGRLEAVSSRLVLLEAERNIRKKLAREVLLRFYDILAGLEPELVEAVSDDDLAHYAAIIAPKDAHVLAAAASSGAAVLLTLDRKHFWTRAVLDAGLPFEILTPGQLLRRWNP